MALYFENVTLLTYQHTPISLGAGIRYKIKKTFTITGKLLALSNASGVVPTWAKADILQANANDYQDVILDGINFGKGKITSISLPEGNHVRELDYEYQIESFETADMSNAGGYYAGLLVPNIASLESLQETFNYTENEHNGKVYEHSISVTFGQNLTGDLDQIAAAKTLITSLMSSTALSQFLGTYTHNTSIKRIHTETYNVIDKNCSVSERIEIPYGVSEASPYVINLSYSIDMDENGIIKATETGDIQGLSVPTNASASQGLADYVNGAFGRVGTVCNSYGFSSFAGLHNVVIEKGVTINKFEGKINYHVTYTNDPHVSDLAIWDYTDSADRSEDGTLAVTESGTIKGLGRPRVDKYPHAKQFYDSTVSGGIQGRTSAIYSTMGGNHTGHLIMVRSDFSSSEMTGEISYSKTWSDASFYNTSNPAIRKQEVEITTVYSIDKIFLVNVLNYKQLMQKQAEVSIAQYEIQINLKGSRSTTLDQYLSIAKSIAQSYTSNGYVQSCSYSFSPLKNEFSLSLTYPFGSN